jgi:hypothetical protein
MSEHADFDRFVGWLGRIGDSYNPPPETPREAIWSSIEVSMGSVQTEDGGMAGASDEVLIGAVAGYNAPPITPHDEMWDRVEAAWTMRRAAPLAAREAGLDDLPENPWGDVDERVRGRSLARWGTVVGIAASLVIGIALGRTSFAPADAGSPNPVGVVATDRPDDARGPASTDSVFEPLETSPPAEPALEVAVTPIPAAAAPTAAAPTRWNVAVRLATAKHLGQAETLLTSFRADASETATTGSMSVWARELLSETRLLLDLPVDRSQREVELLEELELVLAQIARLGPGAPAFERDIVADGLARQGTIARLRAASPPGGTTSIGM